MSYLYSVEHLWDTHAGPYGHWTYPGRPASAVIFLASFIWPHLKLLLVHVCYYATLSHRTRRNGNYWLAFFGKWTLADVLVMCVLIGLFNLTVQMSIPQLYARLKPESFALCETLCDSLPTPPSGQHDHKPLTALEVAA
eukprot:CAMPEP_0183356978 /NCGR_PEP_ID=MMETSP0164_2-20130417/45306_1 /TAXON_ID=221442 /ORGANISM="Coccolithus pelagicus ssp braarudi, Strain PLY182g" /LENGTH=138 /DNA_ID=CAMNT_0025530509 /DNA_START=147 /DNA_END=559 /DNA_ORIENTATION=+